MEFYHIFLVLTFAGRLRHVLMCSVIFSADFVNKLCQSFHVPFLFFDLYLVRMTCLHVVPCQLTETIANVIKRTRVIHVGMERISFRISHQLNVCDSANKKSSFHSWEIIVFKSGESGGTHSWCRDGPGR